MQRREAVDAAAGDLAPEESYFVDLALGHVVGAECVAGYDREAEKFFGDARHGVLGEEGAHDR